MKLTHALTLARLRPPQSVPLAQWLAASFAHEVEFGRLKLFLPVLVAAGIALAVAAPFDVAPLPAAGVTIALALAWALTGRSRTLAPLAGPCAAAAALATGVLALSIQASVVGSPLLTRAQTATVEGVVRQSETRGGGRQRIVLEVEASDVDGPVPRRVRLSVRNAEPIMVGERLAARGRLFPLRGPILPGGYDPSRRLFFDGIGATGFTYGAPERLGFAGPSLGATIHRLRVAVRERIAASLSEPAASFATALLVGLRGGMAEPDVEALRVSGLGHILAISGLHMALVAGSVFAGVRLALALIPGVAIRYPIRKWAAIAGLVVATAYLALSGGAVATVRAYVMLVVALLAVLTDRPALTLRTVAVAAMVVMALDPVSVVEPGFQMSFLAVIALVGAYEWWSKQRLKMPQGWARPVATFLVGLAATSLIAGLATAPAAAFHFHRLAPLGIVGNLGAMPFLTFLAMPAGVIAMVAMPFGLEGLPLTVMGAALEAILAVAHKVAAWTGPAGALGSIPAASALLAAGGLLWLAILTAPWRLFGIAMIAVGLAIAGTAHRPDLIVSEDGSTLAARGPDGSLVFVGDGDGFVASVWRQANGEPRSNGEPQSAGDTRRQAMGRCDGLGCTLPLAAGMVAMPNSPRALMEDCRRAAVVVSRAEVTGCAAPLVLDRSDLLAGGALAARWTPNGWHVQAARPHGAVRAWHVQPSIARD